MAGTWIEIGRVRSVNPRAREVRVDLRSATAHAVAGAGWMNFERAPGDVLRCKVVSVRADDSEAVVVLGAGLPRDTVGELRGARVVMAPVDIPPKPGRHWHLDQLVGLAVVAPDGRQLGTVCDVYEGPANDAFAVARPDGGRCVLPIIEAVVQAVDLEHGMIRVGDVAPYMVED